MAKIKSMFDIEAVQKSRKLLYDLRHSDQFAVSRGMYDTNTRGHQSPEYCAQLDKEVKNWEQNYESKNIKF